MRKIDGHSSEKRKCVVCNHKTGRYKSWGYTDGIEIVVPVCEDCRNKVGYCLDLAMDAHLKSISNSVMASRIITTDEQRLRAISEKMRPRKVIKTDTCSQACPGCGYPVNWKFCSNCGQALSY